MVFFQKWCKSGVKFGFIQIFYLKKVKIEDFNEKDSLFTEYRAYFSWI